MKRYSHPQHGFHTATGGEAEAMLKNGWTECGWEVKKTAAPEVEEALPEVEVLEQPKREVIKLKKG